MSRKVLYFEVEPRGSLYRSLLEWLVPRSEEFWLVVRDLSTPTIGVARALDALLDWRSFVEEVSEWPGTKIIGSASVYRHRCRPSPVPILSELSERLFDWQPPSLPEDLCFVDASGRALLASITHEREAYLDLSTQEKVDLLATIPEIEGNLVEASLPEGW